MGLFLFSKKKNGKELLVLVAGQPAVKLLLTLDFSVCNAFKRGGVVFWGVLFFVFKYFEVEFSMHKVKITLNFLKFYHLQM